MYEDWHSIIIPVNEYKFEMYNWCIDFISPEQNLLVNGLWFLKVSRYEDYNYIFYFMEKEHYVQFIMRFL